MPASKDLPEFFQARPAWRWDAIQSDGLIVSAASSPDQVPCIYLGAEIELSRHYAGMCFGEDGPDDRVVIRIRAAKLDAEALWGDCGQEAGTAFDEHIEPMGFTIEQTRDWQLPWLATFHATGQVTYPQNIRTEHLELFEEIRMGRKPIPEVSASAPKPC